MKNTILNYGLNMLVFCSFSFFAMSAGAKDFGIYGNTYKVVEEPFVQMIENRAKAVDVEKIKEKMQKTAKDRVENPNPVIGITPAVKTRTFYHDPTYVLEKDAVLPCGKVLYRAGTSVNPLEEMKLLRRMIFIDAKRPEEVRWLKQSLNEIDGKYEQILESSAEEIDKAIEEASLKPEIINKIILVGGSPLELQKNLDIEIYFDQQGALTSKWNIKHSPAIVEQEGDKLRITEYKVSKHRDW
jgi:conjugal transfer pilus assembly protein TraW